MVFLGFLLVAAAVVVTVGVVVDNTGPTQLNLFGETAPGVASQWQVFLAGGAVALVFIAGAMLTFIGAGRMMRARRDLRYLREEHEESLSTLEMEKRRLQRELARVRQAGAPGAPGSAGSPQAEAVSQISDAASAAARRQPASAGRSPAGPRNPALSPFFDRKD
ncbi:LapA family protein [Actinomadura graeca]|uniref:LapA family protein n=1 Tax=Actinomadura graeca TaxID=2750812 RepID=A0ABX8QVW9_9ACTN|nr:hypothetical protein [Actinomadura graeca]QXJ22862.1 LapA family protein [Actinomadura graeca]